MIRCFHCQRFLPALPGSDEVKDPYPVSHACVLLYGRDKGTGVIGAVPFVAQLTVEDRVNAAMARWDLG